MLTTDNQEKMQSERSHKYLPPPSLAELNLTPPGKPGERLSGPDLPKMKKFRFQLLAGWVAANFSPCSVGDIAGGKGMLAHFLNQDGFKATVIDPVEQSLPPKYKDLATGKRILIPDDVTVARINKAFSPEMAQNFDLLVGLHAHGVNMMMIDAVAEFGCTAVTMPCCVIDEPQAPPTGKNWFSWLAEYAEGKGLQVDYFYLNFKGQNVGFVTRQP